MGIDWKKTVAAVAPAIGTAIGGPVGGLAVQALCSVFGLDAGTSEEQLAKAIAGMTPEQAVELRKADQQFSVQMRELDIDLERIYQQDRDSARGMAAKTGDRTPTVLAFVVSCGFFGVVAWVLKFGFPDVGGQTVALLVGGVVTAFIQVLNYYFGSSSGSARKTEAMADQVKAGK